MNSKSRIIFPKKMNHPISSFLISFPCLVSFFIEILMWNAPASAQPKKMKKKNKKQNYKRIKLVMYVYVYQTLTLWVDCPFIQSIADRIYDRRQIIIVIVDLLYWFSLSCFFSKWRRVNNTAFHAHPNTELKYHNDNGNGNGKYRRVKILIHSIYIHIYLLEN